MVNYRPKYRHQWGNRSYYSQLRLDTLDRVSAGEMLTVLLGENAELSQLKQLIIERTGGNPFFMEEFLQALFEEGALARNGAVKFTRPLAQLQLPPTVKGILASRIDRQPSEHKQLLQTLAIMGKESPLGLLRHVVPAAEARLGEMLADLQASEFIYEHPALPDVKYVFKHALTQEVAYNSLLSERRKLLHERAAQGLEVLFIDCIDDHLADLAYHYSRSGNDAKAIEYQIRAGELAHQRSAFSQAAAYFQDAIARLKDLPADAERDRKEMAIHTGLADVSMVTSGYAAPEYERHLTRRSELAERLGDATQLFYSLVGISVLSAFRLELTKAREIGEASRACRSGASRYAVGSPRRAG
jgi:predicted ATPase